jgi:rRNA-processing protein FCF1
MKEKVIFDTNIIRNTEVNNFFGGREVLERFAKVADIVIPETVIQEIKRQKHKNLASNKTKFLNNPFHKLIGVSESDTKTFAIEEHIQSLMDAESILFETIDIKDNNILPKIKELALNKEAPFECSDNTDKGFKDALIYFSVLEYLQEVPNKNVFVCAKDGRLKEALDKHPNIIVIESYEEFKSKSVSQFFNEYFIAKVNEELHLNITAENIIEYWHNIDDNQVVLIKAEECDYIIEVDSGEILDTTKTDDFAGYSESLINSASIEEVGANIEQIAPFAKYLSDDEIKSILESVVSNEFIFWDIETEITKQFVGSLYKAKKEIIEGEAAEFLKENFE